VAATFEIGPRDLVIAASPQAPLTISLGAPVETVTRHQVQFLLGLLGAVLAIGSAMVLALVIDGTIP
jgi:hypothetical protein